MTKLGDLLVGLWLTSLLKKVNVHFLYLNPNDDVIP